MLKRDVPSGGKPPTTRETQGLSQKGASQWVTTARESLSIWNSTAGVEAGYMMEPSKQVQVSECGFRIKCVSCNEVGVWASHSKVYSHFLSPNHMRALRKFKQTPTIHLRAAAEKKSAERLHSSYIEAGTATKMEVSLSLSISHVHAYTIE